MSFKFEMPSDFAEQLKKAGAEVANEGVKQLAEDVQAICDATFDHRQSKSADELYVELKSKLEAREFNLPEEHLRAYADAIAEGRRVKIEVDSAS